MRKLKTGKVLTFLNNNFLLAAALGMLLIVLRFHQFLTLFASFVGPSVLVVVLNEGLHVFESLLPAFFSVQADALGVFLKH